MVDIVVTCPQRLWHEWIGEGALPGEECPEDVRYHWFMRGLYRPDIVAGERVYIVAHGRLRGYAPLECLMGVVTGRKRTEHSLFAVYGHGIPIEFIGGPLLPEWWWPGATMSLVRGGGAVACTIPEPVRGFQGWRKRWWNYEDEVPFPDWERAGVVF